MKRAVNPDTGEVVFLVNNQWVSPASSAVNESGEKAYLVNNKWVLPPAAMPEPIITPDEQMAAPPDVDAKEGVKASDFGKQIAAGAIAPTAAIPLGLESSVRNVPRQIAEQQTIKADDGFGPLTFAKELVRLGPSQLFTNTARAFTKAATGESFEKQQENQKQNEITLDRTISKIPRVPGFSQLADAGKKASESISESISEAGKKAIADSQVQGNIIDAIQEQSLEKLSFGNDPSFVGYALQGSQVLGSLLPIIGTAVMTKGNTKAVGTVGFGMGAGEAVQSATEYISKLSDAQLIDSSPYFKKMVEDGVNPVEARKVITDKAAEYAAQLQGSVAAFGGVVTGKLITGQFDKLITGSVKNRLGRIALGTTAGSLEEGTQEFLEGVAKDLGINKAVIKEIGEESFANFVLGAMGGAGPGAYRGAIAKDAKDTPPLDTPPVDETQPPVPPTDTTEETEVTEPKAPVSGAIGVDELETDETEAATNVPKAEVPEGIDPELYARASLRFDQLLAQEELSGNLSKRDINKLARELEIEPSKDIEQTVGSIYQKLFPNGPAPQDQQEVEQNRRQAEFRSRFVDADNNGVMTKQQADELFELSKSNLDEAESLLAQYESQATAPAVEETEEAAPVVQEAEEVVTAAPVVADVPAVEEPKELVGAEKKLDDLIKNKDSIVKQMAENNKISPEYAAKAYDAELEYTRAASRAYEDHPNPISEKDFKAAIKKHDTFFNKLKGVSSRAKETKPKETPKVIKHDDIEYADTPRIRGLIKKAEDIQSNLPPVQEGMVRLYRGNREEEVGKNPSFTNSLVGIALPFQESYGGNLSYLDIPQADLNKYEAGSGSASGSEFILPKEIAKQAKETKPKEVKKTPAEINRERQADKKAAAVDATEEKMVDAIQGMAYKKNGMTARVSANDFIAKFGRKMFDDAVKADLLDNEPGEGRLFPSNNYVYKVVQKYYDGKGNKIKAAKETKPKAEPAPKAEVKPKVEEVKIAEEKEVPQAEVKTVQEFPKEKPVSKEYQTALNKSRKATKAFQSAQDGYRKQLINDEEFIAARKRHDEAMAEYDAAYAEEAERPESIKVKPAKTKSTANEKPVEGFDAYVDGVSDQIDRLVEFARIDLRTGITREEVINKLRATFKDGQEKAQGALDTTEANMLKAAKERLLGDLKADYREETGKPLSKEADLVRAIKSGVLDISGQENADDVYKLYDIKKSDIKKVSTEGGVPALIDKFKGSFFGKPTEVSEEVYDQAAKEFLEGPLTAKVPTGKMDSINPVRLQDVSPQPIEKKINPVAKTFADLTKVLYQIAAKEDIRFYLKGVNVEKAKKRLVVTDGHRMAAINDISLKDVPKAEGNATVYTKDNKYIDGQFPDVDRVLPTKHAKNKVTIDVAPLGDYARGANKSWRFISSRMAAPVPLIIGESTYAFNAKYIEDMSNLFRQLGYDTAEVSLADGKLYATSPDGKVQQVVMSMREDRPLYSKYALERNMVISGEGLIREITPEDRKLLTNSTKELTDAETSKLEKVYGSKRGSDEFLQKLRDDATKYINDGANSIEKAIRSIIAKVAAAMLSVAIVFNPNFMSDASAVVIPQQTVEVRAEVPKDAASMSAAGKKAYATLYPALQAGLQKNNKFFTVVDKPTSQMFVFNPDGSMLLKSNVLLGSQFGDNYVGQTDFKENRMTPAGLFKPKAEKGSVTYDGKTVYTFGNVKEGWNAVFMHSVYLKAGDADARLKGLATGDRTRLSYGCINGPENVMERLDNSSMDESHVFIVPDNQAAVDDYITNKVSNEDLTRETVTPVTKKVPSQRSKTMTEAEVFGREEEASNLPKTQIEINQERLAKKREEVLQATNPLYGNFTNNIDETKIGRMRQDIKKELSDSSRQVKTSLTKILRTLAKGQVGIRTQREATELLEARTELNRDKKFARIEIRSADWFLKSAITDAEMHRTYPRDEKYGLEPEVLDVIKDVHAKFPKLLEGLKLSIKKSEGGGTAGNFGPFSRLVTLYKDTSGTSDPKTFRHEIMHSVEQMMPDDVYQIVIDNWAKSLGKAIENYTDKAHQTYFERVLDFTNNPTDENFRKALAVLPSYEMYQYINPSEFWAVNAEKLFASKLGGRWDNFKRAVIKVFESLKNVFGFRNTYGVHKAFDQLFKGPLERGDNKRMLVDYLFRNNNKEEFTFLNNVEDIDALLEKHERPDTPIDVSDSVKDQLLQKKESFIDYVEQYKKDPGLETSNMIGGLDRAVTYARNKAVYFGTGLDLADVKRYEGQLTADDGFAVASIALTNAVHAGHVGTQAVFQGGVRFDPITQQFRAFESKYSIANIIREKAKLIEQLGEQRASNVIQAFFEAKRSRSIRNEFYDRQAEYENLKAAFEAAVDTETKDTYYKQMVTAQEELKDIELVLEKVNMTEEAVDDFIALENKYPELKAMMRNWTAVNQNMIDIMEFSSIISKKRAETLRNIKDYVPWQRIQDDMADPHSPSSVGTRGLTNISGVKRFKKGKTDKDINDILDNMISNVMMTTRNSIRNYAANRIAQQYATRNDKNKIKVFPKEGTTADGAVRVNILANGRRIIVEIKDPLIAEAVLGMETIEIPMINALGIMANGLRRGITSNPIFQVKQLFMDAPTAALVSGVKNPGAVWAGTFKSFIASLNPNDPIIKMFKSYGIGGYQSSSRTPEKELKVQIGLIGKSPLAYMLKLLDQIGDASDYAQRRSVYLQILKETKTAKDGAYPNGNEMQALLQANNVIDFLKHGSGAPAQAAIRTVAFMNAYAQSMDVLAQAMAGGGLKGKKRKQVFNQFVKTGLLLTTVSLIYCFLIGDDEEYQKMDDQTRARNFIIPKSLTKLVGMENSVKIPMHTGASFFFKAVPEIIYNKIMKQGTNNHVDGQRFRTALKEAALDSLLGPNVTPTGVKPFIEIALNKNFFTGGNLTPRGMEDLEAFRQYTASTSELGKIISAMTSVPFSKSRALNPIEADHLVKSLFGTAGAAAMWGSNLFSGDRPEANASANPLYGAFVSAPVPRGQEDIYYDLKERATTVHNTFVDMMKKGRTEQAKEYRKENELLFKAYGYTNGVEQGLKKLNAEIRRVSDLPGDKLSPEEKRERITFYQNKKNDILKDVIVYRRKAGL